MTDNRKKRTKALFFRMHCNNYYNTRHFKMLFYLFVQLFGQKVLIYLIVLFTYGIFWSVSMPFPKGDLHQVHNLLLGLLIFFSPSQEIGSKSFERGFVEFSLEFSLELEFVEKTFNFIECRCTRWMIVKGFSFLTKTKAATKKIHNRNHFFG